MPPPRDLALQDDYDGVDPAGRHVRGDRLRRRRHQPFAQVPSAGSGGSARSPHRPQKVAPCRRPPAWSPRRNASKTAKHLTCRTFPRSRPSGRTALYRMDLVDFFIGGQDRMRPGLARAADTGRAAWHPQLGALGRASDETRPFTRSRESWRDSPFVPLRRRTGRNISALHGTLKKVAALGTHGD